MKRLTAILLALFCVYCLTGCGSRSLSEVKIDYGKSAIYTKEEMDEAIEVIRQRFTEEQWKDCELHRIAYGADEQCNAENLAWMNELRDPGDAPEPFTRCIMFTSEFHSPKTNSGAFNTDEEYYGWQWWLARTDGGQWQIMTCGY